jgi:flavin reductase (DIM6/NTAB) family NADH-FMN oxidoreductase RutF
MKTFNCSDLSIPKLQQYLQYCIAPRPICFASTINKNGQVNLSPYSFFNLFSSNPPIVVFSPSRRVRNNTIKHTLENVLEVPEVVINVVTYDMVQQMSLSSCEYPSGINEFEKAGFTMQKASIVQPPMVLESPAKLECKVIEIKPLGDQGGAGNLVIAEVLRFHLDTKILDEQDNIIPSQLHLIARLGGDWYCKVDETNLFKVPKPNTELGIGIDALPYHIKSSKFLTGNHLGMLGNVASIPTADPAFSNDRVKQIFQYYSLNPSDLDRELHQYAAELLNQGKVDAAWQVLLMTE